MKNPFKKNTPEEDAAAPEQEGEQPEHKKKTKLKISFKNFIVRESEEDAAEAAKAKADQKAAQRAERERLKEEKQKAKEAKKQKAAEAPAEEADTREAPPEEAGAEDAPAKKKKEKPEKIKREPGAKKKGPPLVPLIVGGVVVAAGILLAVLFLTRDKGPTVGERLLAAAELAVAGDYVGSHAIYQELLTADELLVDAYLGQADNYVLQEDVGAAIGAVTLGFDLTQDPRLETRLMELTALQSEEPEAPTEPPAVPIVWQDKNLEAMVRMAMGRTGTDPITTADAREITTLKIVGSTHAAANTELQTANTLEGYTVDGELYTERGGITSLADLASFPSLTKLTVCYNQVSDLSGLESLTGLETLGLYCNNISDISPLSGLTSLKYAYLYANEIEELSPLANLSGLTALYLQNNRLADISPLAGLAALRELYLNNNEITDIAAVANLTELRSFYARNNRITDFSPIWELPSLSDTAIDGNPADSE